MKVMMVLICVISILYASESTFIEIDLAKNKIMVYKDGDLIISGKALGGRKGYKSPLGEFKIYKKEKKHISSKFPKPNGGAKMPYSMFLKKGNRMLGVALHVGSLKKKSHGCIHLSWKVAKYLYNNFPLNTEVWIHK